MQSDEDDLPIDVKEEDDSFSATANRPKSPTRNRGGDETLEAAPPSRDPQHALLRPHCELPSVEVAVQGRGRSTEAIVIRTDSNEDPPPVRPEPKWGAVNDLGWEEDAKPPDLVTRYGEDPPVGAGEAVGAVGGADWPPASFMSSASSLGINIKWNTIPANQTFEEDLAGLGVQLREDTAKQPVDDEFFDIIRELDEESDGKTKKQKSFHQNV